MTRASRSTRSGLVHARFLYTKFLHAAPLALLSLLWADRACAAYDPETDGWKVGIGDASAFGYFSFVLYMIASLVFHRRLRFDGDGFSKAARYAMLFLALNKVLDLQTGVADWGKHIALDGGWYGGRSIVQLMFIVLGIMFGVWAARALPKRLGDTWPQHKTSVFAFVALVVFILVRASSLHQLAFLGNEWSGLRLGTAIEVVLTAGVIVGARRSAQLPARGQSAPVIE